MAKYTDEQLAFLKTGHLSMQVPKLTTCFNAKFGLDKTESQIKSTLTNHQFRSGRMPGNLPGVPTSITAEQFGFIKDQYLVLSLAELTLVFNQTFGLQKTEPQIRGLTRNHGVKSGRTGQFIKGHKPLNKGTVGIMKSNKTSFKKGATPFNIQPIGHERICSRGGYILIKVAEKNPYNGHPTRYRAKHHVVWEAHHGAIPASMIVRFKNSDKLNCSIDNLELLSLAENLRLNKMKYNALPEELKPTAMAVAKLEVKRFGLLNKELPSC